MEAGHGVWGLLWRAPTQLDLPVVAVLPDGTYTTALIDPKIRGARRAQIIAAAKNGEDLDPDLAPLARVIEYDVPDREGNGSAELIVLLTTITPRRRTGGGYHQRWEEETGNDQLTTHLRGPDKVQTVKHQT